MNSPPWHFLRQPFLLLRAIMALKRYLIPISAHFAKFLFYLISASLALLALYQCTQCFIRFNAKPMYISRALVEQTMTNIPSVTVCDKNYKPGKAMEERLFLDKNINMIFLARTFKWCLRT